jgi:hypothetical protein
MYSVLYVGSVLCVDCNSLFHVYRSCSCWKRRKCCWARHRTNANCEEATTKGSNLDSCKFGCSFRVSLPQSKPFCFWTRVTVRFSEPEFATQFSQVFPAKKCEVRRRPKDLRLDEVKSGSARLSQGQQSCYRDVIEVKTFFGKSFLTFFGCGKKSIPSC